jgi:ribosomal protein S12 methylthiotransferase accessory factor
MNVENITSSRYGLSSKNFHFLKKLVNRRVGIIKKLHLFLRENEDIPIYNVVADHAILDILSGSFKEVTKLRSGGVGFSIDEAISRCIGEVVERYCWNLFGLVHEKEFIFGSYSQLVSKYNLYPIEKIYLFSEEQYKRKGFVFRRLRENTKLTWVPLFTLKGKEIYYPAQLILGKFKLNKDEEIIGYSTTSGVAAGRTYKEAFLNGIFEQIERDAFMITWFNKITPPKISKDSVFKLLGIDIIEKISSEHYYFDFYDITLDIPIPTVLSILISKRKFPDMKIIVGASTRLTYKDAIYKSMLESIQGVAFAKRSLLFYDYEKIDINNITNFDENFIYYLSSKNFKKFQFITNSKKTKEVKEYNKKKNSDKKILEILKKKKMDVLYLNLTLNEIEELGLYVVKVLVPELVQLSLPSYPFLGHPRFKKFVKKGSIRFNKYPHPMP